MLLFGSSSHDCCEKETGFRSFLSFSGPNLPSKLPTYLFRHIKTSMLAHLVQRWTRYPASASQTSSHVSKRAKRQVPERAEAGQAARPLRRERNLIGARDCWDGIFFGGRRRKDLVVEIGACVLLRQCKNFSVCFGELSRYFFGITLNSDSLPT